MIDSNPTAPHRKIPTAAVVEWASTKDKNARGAIARGLRAAGYTQIETARDLGVSTRTVERYELIGHGERPFNTAPPRPTAADSIPEEVLADLRDTLALTSTVRGFTPLDAPARQAVPRLSALILDTVDRYDVSTYALSLKLGLSGETLDRWLKRHGFRKNPPSQKTYRNVTTRDRRRPKIRVYGAECKRGHVLTPETVYDYDGRLVCKPCTAETSKRRRAAQAT